MITSTRTRLTCATIRTAEGIQDEMEQKATEAANNERELQRARDVLKKGVVEKILEQRLEAAVARCRAEREVSPRSL